MKIKIFIGFGKCSAIMSLNVISVSLSLFSFRIYFIYLLVFLFVSNKSLRLCSFYHFFFFLSLLQKCWQNFSLKAAGCRVYGKISISSNENFKSDTALEEENSCTILFRDAVSLLKIKETPKINLKTK